MLGFFTTFRGKLLLSLLGFALLSELVIATAVLHTTYQQTLTQARNNLQVGEQVLRELISSRGEQLLSAVDIVASDSDFKSALAKNDTATLKSTLADYGTRLDADIRLLVGPSGHLVAAHPGIPSANQSTLPFRDLLKQARENGDAVGLVSVGDRAYQIALAPVHGPKLIAWAGMGFQFNDRLAYDLASLVGLNVEFLLLKNDQTVFHAGTLEQATGKPLPASSNTLIASRRILLYLGGNRLDVVLALDRSQVLAPFYALAKKLLLLFLLTLGISAVIAFWLARRISGPINRLSAFACSVAAGAYHPAPPDQGFEELNTLASALDRMQNAVRWREHDIRQQAQYDALTGLPNREFMRHIAQQHFEDSEPFAAIRVGIHEFARINGALGYQLGDQLLKTVAKRLRAAFDDRHPLGRVEGNDFLLLLSYDTDEAELARVIDKLRSTLQARIRLGDTLIALVLEIGIVMVPRFAPDLDTLWRRTLLARSRSRENRGQTTFYEYGLDEQWMRELRIIQDLAGALQRDELHLVYQPKMSLSNGAVRQVEALARWMHPELGVIPPDEFVCLAERSGQVSLLTQWVVKQLTAQIRHWQSIGLDDMGVALNLSADELADARLTHLIAPLLKAALPGQRITLEITESALLRNPERAMANLACLQRLGARIAVDDFGAGYSSLAQLKQLSANELKIDKSLVLKLDTNPEDQFIVQTITELGHRLGLEVVAEGIENNTAWHRLTEIGADAMQGYFLARPMPACALEAWLPQHADNMDQWRKIA